MSQKGFSLVELMIVIAIIGVLLAIAIPNFVSMQYHARRAEIPANVDSIRAAEIAYNKVHDEYVAIPTWVPTSLSGSETQSWPMDSAFTRLGWQPDGNVRGIYRVNTSMGAQRPEFTVTGLCDVDGDGINAKFTATRTMEMVMVTHATTY